MISKPAIKDFFSRYALTMNNALQEQSYDIKVFLDSFSEYVVGASPLGVFGGKNDQLFSNSIRQGIDFYKKIGITSMNIRAVEITVLDEYHVLANVHWSSSYAKEKFSGEILFQVIYIVQCKDLVSKIFAFVTGDEMSVLRQHQLID